MRTADKIIGQLLYYYGMLWYWPFDWVVGRWYWDRGWTRHQIAKYIAGQFMWVRNWRYEMNMDDNGEKGKLW